MRRSCLVFRPFSLFSLLSCVRTPFSFVREPTLLFCFLFGSYVREEPLRICLSFGRRDFLFLVTFALPDECSTCSEAAAIVFACLSRGLLFHQIAIFFLYVYCPFYICCHLWWIKGTSDPPCFHKHCCPLNLKEFVLEVCPCGVCISEV